LAASEKELVAQISNLLSKQTWLSTQAGIRLLRDNTGQGKLFDPIINPDTLFWNTVGTTLLGTGRLMEALTVFQSQLKSYMDAQEETGKRIHKGTPYHYLGRVYIDMGKFASAREQFLLAFIEDILTEIQYGQGVPNMPSITDAFTCPAPIVLDISFAMRNTELKDLYAFTKSTQSSESDNDWHYPEMMLLKWRNFKDKNRDEGPIVARAIEVSLFHTNPHNLRHLLQKALADSSGTNMEELATYLFSCVDGFEPIPRQQTDAFHFDVVVRNLVSEHPLLKMFGEYIGVESKNVKTTVSVEQLNHFIMKLRLHSMKCGVIFTNEGISGLSFGDDERYGKSIQIRTFNRDDIIVFDITVADLKRMIDGDNLISILLAKYEDIRFR
jgi:hypothetical protein